MSTTDELDQLSINTIRTLSIDAVQAANSGHPGTPMALAPLVYTLWNRVMRFDPQDPIWPNRDRFVLSNGHASMLLWSVLHLSGVRAVNADYECLGAPAVTLDDIKRFRQLGSKAPGHPEYHWVSGVETTTGPLGQGIATSVGMAMAQRWLAKQRRQLRQSSAGLRDPGVDPFGKTVHHRPQLGVRLQMVGDRISYPDHSDSARLLIRRKRRIAQKFGQSAAGDPSCEIDFEVPIARNDEPLHPPKIRAIFRVDSRNIARGADHVGGPCQAGDRPTLGLVDPQQSRRRLGKYRRNEVIPVAAG